MHQFQSNNGGHDRARKREWRISNFPRFWQNQSAAEPFNAFFENNLPLGLFRQNMKKSTTWRRVREFWYLLTLTLKVKVMESKDCDLKPRLLSHCTLLPPSPPSPSLLQQVCLFRNFFSSRIRGFFYSHISVLLCLPPKQTWKMSSATAPRFQFWQVLLRIICVSRG